MSKNQQFFVSLLYPAEHKPESNQTVDTTPWMDDLNITPILDVLAIDNKYRATAKKLLTQLIQNSAVIRYRQDVLEDLLNHPSLVVGLGEILNTIALLNSYSHAPQWQESQLRLIAWRISELESYVQCITQLDVLMEQDGVTFKSEGLTTLYTAVKSIVQDALFQHLKEELPILAKEIRGVSSVTIGINLDDRLQPIEATLLSVNTERFVGASFMNRLFSKRSNRGENEGLSELHSAIKSLQAQAFNVSIQDKDAPLLVPLFYDLAEILDQSSRPIARALKRYIEISGTFLLRLESEIAYYLGAVRLIQVLQNCGLPMCRPDVLGKNQREYRVNELYNISFALRTYPNRQPCDLRDDIVRNDVVFGDTGRIFILTGPNRGGKTTYIQAVGLAQLLMQAGLYVPGTSASMSPVDSIYTHFATVEKPETGTGRLGEEAQRLNKIFSKATSHSLLLLNESFASTSAGESFFLARDVVLALRLLGGRAIFATHLHELAADIDAMNEEVTGSSLIISMVSVVQMENVDNSPKRVRRTYKILPGPPMGRSYAHEIAVQYGISFDQLKKILDERDNLQTED